MVLAEEANGVIVWRNDNKRDDIVTGNGVACGSIFSNNNVMKSHIVMS